MIFPTVHMNGDTAKSLMETHYAAMSAVQDAMDSLAKSGPNGRNYYPQGPSAIDTALAEHRSRMARLQAVREELEAICIHLSTFPD